MLFKLGIAATVLFAAMAAPKIVVAAALLMAAIALALWTAVAAHDKAKKNIPVPEPSHMPCRRFLLLSVLSRRRFQFCLARPFRRCSYLEQWLQRSHVCRAHVRPD